MKKDRLRRRARRARRARRGFNLLELMVVVTIIGMIAGIVSVSVFGAMKQARLNTAKTEISNLEHAVGMFQVRFSRFPTTQEGLAVLMNPPGDLDGFIEELPADPWGQAYTYSRPDPRGKKKFLLLSPGPDGMMDTEDDIRN